MNPIDWILLAAVAAVVIFAVLLTLRRRRKGSACGCPGSCPGCGKCEAARKESGSRRT